MISFYPQNNPEGLLFPILQRKNQCGQVIQAALKAIREQKQ